METTRETLLVLSGILDPTTTNKRETFIGSFRDFGPFDNMRGSSQNLWLRSQLLPVPFLVLLVFETRDLLHFLVAMSEALTDPGTLSPPTRKENIKT